MTDDDNFETEPESGRAVARERRAAKATRRETMLEMVVSGYDRALIAEKLGVSLATVRREVERAIDQRRLDAPDRYVRLQVARLTKALLAVDYAIERGDLRAVDPLVKLVAVLDRYHGVGTPAPAAPAATRLRLARATAHLALTHAAPSLDRIELIDREVA